MARWKAVNWTRYHSLLTCLAERGHEIIVLQPPPLMSDETNFQEIEVDIPERLRLVDVDVPMWLWKRRLPLDKIIKKGIYSICSLKTAKNIITEYKVDAILLYNIPQYGFLGLKGPLLVFDYADDYIAMLRQELGPMAFRPILRLARKMLDKMIMEADLVLSVSHVLAENITSDAKVLPNGVSLEKVEYALSNPLNLNLPKPIIGFVGSFEYFINFEIILETAKSLPQATFLLVGHGRELGRVREMVRTKGLRNVHLTGGVPHKDIFRYIDKMDVCLNIFNKGPVADAASPIKLFEYISMGKPVVTTRHRELEYVDKGFLFFADDVEDICRKITEIVEMSPSTLERIQRGKEEVRRHYTWASISDRFSQMIRGESGASEQLTPNSNTINS